MLSDEFSKVFTGLTERMDMFFHNKLKGAGIHENRELLKEELIQDTAYAVLLKLEKEKYNDYSLIALIWIKAMDVWVDFVKSQKKSKLFIRCQDEELVMIPEKSDPFELFEQRQWLDTVKANNDHPSWHYLQLHADGFLYKNIADHFGKTRG